MTVRGRQALVTAFDRLFEHALHKLGIQCTPEEKERVKQDFYKRFDNVLELADQVDFPEIPEPVMQRLEEALDDVSPAHVAGYIAAGPLAIQVQNVLRQIAMRHAQERMLEQLMEQADDRYGGN